MNIKKKFFVSILIVTLLISATSVNAATTKKSDTYKGKNLFNMTVASTTFYAEGDTSLHKVYNYYNTSSSVPLNSIENKEMWKATFPSYEKACYSFSHKVGLPTPWGTIGYEFTSQYLDHKY